MKWVENVHLKRETCLFAQRAELAVSSSLLVTALDSMKVVEGFVLELQE